VQASRRDPGQTLAWSLLEPTANSRLVGRRCRAYRQRVAPSPGLNRRCCGYSAVLPVHNHHSGGRDGRGGFGARDNHRNGGRRTNTANSSPPPGLPLALRRSSRHRGLLGPCVGVTVLLS